MTILETYANSADPVQTPQKAASDQDLHCLLTEISIQNTVKVKKKSLETLRTTNGPKDGPVHG